MRRTPSTSRIILVVFGAAGLVLPTHQVGARTDSSANRKAGRFVNVVPFGECRLANGGKQFMVIWEDPRDIFRVVVRWADGQSPPLPEAVRLEYWQSSWPRRRIPRDRPSGAGGSGWLNIGDWYNGRWRVPDARIEVRGRTWTYTFNPINAKEFPDLQGFDARYRSTLKLRLAADTVLPRIESFKAYTDSVWRRADVAIVWGGKAEGGQTWDGRIEIFNGWLEKLRPLGPGSSVEVERAGTWKSRVAGKTDGIVATIKYAEPKALNSFDETVATVRTEQATFSFAMRDLMREGVIFMPDYGVLVRKAKLDISHAEAEKKWKQNPKKDLYSRVFDMPEQTLPNAWSDMPPKDPHYIPLGFEGGRQHFGVDEHGEVFCFKRWLERIKGKDTPRCLWQGSIRYSLGLPQSRPVEREIEDGYLPVIRAAWEGKSIRYEQTAFVVPFAGVPRIGQLIEADDTLVLMMRIRLGNVSHDRSTARLAISVRDRGGIEQLVENDGFIYSLEGDKRLLRLLFRTKGRGKLQENNGRLNYMVELRPGEGHSVDVAIPFITLSEPDELAQLREMDFDTCHKRVRDYWRERIAQSAQIYTPEPMINDFYRAHAYHLLINTEREVGSDRAMAKVGTFHYGVYSNESVMMLSDLDRRGYHDVARRGYETWLHYQGTVGLPGDFSTKEGQFYGAGGYEAGGYNQHHGWVLWGLGEHYWYTRDRKWLEHAAPHIVKACDWIINERRRNTERAGTSLLRRIEKGLLPPGRLEDIGDWRCWLSTNAYTWWGMDNAARALAEIGHPEAKRLLSEAAAYRRDIITAFTEAMRRSPVVKLRDGSWIPHVPPEVHRRGRCFGWITETLEGAIHLVRCGVLEPWDPISTWIIRDFEDNLYISEQFGYNMKGKEFEKYWFSRGGISMQANLLCNPIPYLLRDEPKHFLRAYFNAFAVSYFPDTRMMTEHALPNIGDWRGDHYKASDESNSTYWLRLMFIQEHDDELLLGAAVPRYWLEDGREIGIERASTYFGKMSMRMISHAGDGSKCASIRRGEIRRQRSRHDSGIPRARKSLGSRSTGFHGRNSAANGLSSKNARIPCAS